MNKSKLKTYAPQARKDFIAAVTQRANLLGLSDTAGELEALPAERQGDVVLIAGREWPARVALQRERLVRRIERDGFAYTMEAVAYTWFNRFAALRFMELHDYLGHGHRVLSSGTAGGLPDILTHAADLANSRELPGLDADHIAELKLAGNKDGELYRLLLVAQCNALSAAMPFLFERIDDETELLLPDNLLRTDSVIARLATEIPEEDWAEVEIIGWLYQFYISEKKDQVIGKVVKSEDIPAATQLFTPNWIVQYLVQNSVGRLWLMANPTSTLKAEWPYYIEPAEQTPEVNAQLDALIQTRMAEDGGSLNPESITVLDPACGSGHILVEAYALLKGIYLERGYRLRDIPRLILEKNLYGLDIDDRAAQLAGFALLMKARADDRRLFNDPPRLNVLSLQESKGLELEELATHLAPFGVQRATVKALLDTFEHAKTFGSLIQISDGLNAQLPALAEGVGKASESGDLYAQAAARDLLPLVEQGKVLGWKFDAVVANPPYMGRKGFVAELKSFAGSQYDIAKVDLFAMFMVRGYALTKSSGMLGMITLPSWMFLSSFVHLRDMFVENTTVNSLLHLGRGIFGIDWGSVAFIARKSPSPNYVGRFYKLHRKVFQYLHPSDIERIFLRVKLNPDYRYDFRNYRNEDGFTPIPDQSNPNGDQLYYEGRISDFMKIPGRPVAYWLPKSLYEAFDSSHDFGAAAGPRVGMQTSSNEFFLRLWWEVSWDKTSLADPSSMFWIAYLKGGDFRKWWGNGEYVLRYEYDGSSLRAQPNATQPDPATFECPRCNWSDIGASKPFAARRAPARSYFDIKAHAFFPEENGDGLLAFSNSCLFNTCISVLNPGLNFQVGDAKRVPTPPKSVLAAARNSEDRCVEASKLDWDAYERSWDFQSLPILRLTSNLESSYNFLIAQSRNTIAEVKRLEEENNRLFIDAFGLEVELSPDVPIEQITLTMNPAYRYGGNLTEEEQWARLRQDTMAELISYAIGCMMGRYSLDEPGLIYAHAGNVGFDATRYQTFPADADGIVPITDELWFEDDAAHRVREFLRAVWGADTLDENMAWLAEGLGTKAGETPDETIRRYLADKFFKDHLQTYKKRPIYWLFSSGKQGAFQALVYLHRYHEGTLARLRAEYVVPLTGKLQARIEMLEKDAATASSTAARNKLNKQLEKLRKKHVELLTYDEKLRHHADMRISLDLDDGVRVNYGKFGDLLAEVKAVTGGAED